MPLLQPPTPTAGFRSLNKQEALAAAKFKAANICPDGKCEKDIYIGIFFDGTGNNNISNENGKPDIDEGKQTNVVRLFNAFEEHKKDKRFYKYYIQGVGTPFPEISDSGLFTPASILGGGMAYKGEDRIWFGLLQLLNGVHHAVFGEAQWPTDSDVGILAEKLGETIGADMLLFGTFMKALQEKLKDAKPRITKINLSVFGFSRGAAQARVFCTYLNELCTKNEGVFAGIPIKVDFLGIFDTVASVGFVNLLDMNIGATSGHARWAQHGYLNIAPNVSKTTHFVAGTETRSCFPSDLAVGASQIREFVYPGSHSDVGGGYMPKALGIKEVDYARLIAQHMYFEAIAAGVPLRTESKLPADAKQDLTTTNDVAKQFIDYMQAVQPKGSAIEQIRQHWRAYLCSRLEHQEYKLDPLSPVDILANTGLTEQSRQQFCYRLAEGKDKEWLKETHFTLLDYKAMYVKSKTTGLNGFSLSDAMALKGYTYGAAGMNALIDLYNGAYPFKNKDYKGKFLDTYVHDSHAGFMKTLSERTYNRRGIMSWRSVYSGSTTDIGLAPQHYTKSDFHKALMYFYENVPAAKNNEKARQARFYEAMRNLAWTYGPGTEKGKFTPPAKVQDQTAARNAKNQNDALMQELDRSKTQRPVAGIGDSTTYENINKYDVEPGSYEDMRRGQ